jgi:hypothetical protein
MAYIQYVPEDDASPELKKLYDRYRNPEGIVDNILRIHGLNPQSMVDHVGLYRTVVHGRSPLSRAQREMIAVVVSAVNECHY